MERATEQQREELLARLEADIRKSGFPLEMYALGVCERHELFSLPSSRYEVDGTTHEIDLTASLAVEPKREGRTFEELQDTVTTMVVECKKSFSKPWVFFSTPLHSGGSRIMTLNLRTTLDMYLERYKQPPLILQLAEQLSPLFAESNVPRCVSYYEAFNKENHQSAIYKAVQTVMSFIDHELGQFDQNQLAAMTFVFMPVILLDGDMFHASINDEQITLSRAEHLALRISHRGATRYIDIVTKTHFEQYAQWFRALHAMLVQSINSVRLTPSDIRIIADHQQIGVGRKKR